jgi:hypothetical protein
VTHQQIAGKGENKTTVAPDLDMMGQLTKGGPMIKFKKLDLGPGTKVRSLVKKLRDVYKVSTGDAVLSEYDTSSDSEYDSD